jgi:hypothetical protein
MFALLRRMSYMLAIQHHTIGGSQLWFSGRDADSMGLDEALDEP